MPDSPIEHGHLMISRSAEPVCNDEARDIPLIFFSGLAADERLFRAQMDAFPQLVVPKWIDPLPGESLVEYAR